MGCSQEKIQNSCWLIRLGISVVEFTSRLQNGSLGRLVCLYIERAAMCGFLGNVLEMLNFAPYWQTSWVTLVYTMSLIGLYTYFGSLYYRISIIICFPMLLMPFCPSSSDFSVPRPEHWRDAARRTRARGRCLFPPGQ